MNPTVFVGVATVPVVIGLEGYLFNPLYTTLSLQLDTVNINWGTTGPPLGANNSNTLNIQIPQGYAVGIEAFYTMTGHWYTDVGGKQSWVDTILEEFIPNMPSTPRRASAMVFENDGNNWNYTATNPFIVPTATQLIGPPDKIYYRFNTTSVFNYQVQNFTWNVIIKMTVTQSCNITNIMAPLCVSLCQSDPLRCFTQYAEFCLSPGNEARIGTPLCKNYLASYITKNGSTAEIDHQVQNYCSAKYSGFNDLFGTNPLNPTGLTPDQANDLPICACNIRARGENDPNATVLYDRYFSDLTQKVPGFGNLFGNLGIVDKCALPVCASATFHPLPIPIGGCKVPQCITIIDVTNNGTINGNVEISTNQNCGQIVNPNEETIGNLVIIIVVILVILIIIYILYLFFIGNRRPLGGSSTTTMSRGTSSTTYIPRGTTSTTYVT